MELTLQEQEIINILRRRVPFERIELMKDKDGVIGNDIIISRASKERILPTGKIVHMQTPSVLLKTGG